MLSVGSGASQCPEMTTTAFGRTPKVPSMPRRYAASPSHICGYAGGGSMKKHGPPPCGIYNVGSLLAAFTMIFRPPQTSRVGLERQLRGPPRADLSNPCVDAGTHSADGTRPAALHVLQQVAEKTLQ